MTPFLVLDSVALHLHCQESAIGKFDKTQAPWEEQLFVWVWQSSLCLKVWGMRVFGEVIETRGGLAFSSGELCCCWDLAWG